MATVCTSVLFGVIMVYLVVMHFSYALATKSVIDVDTDKRIGMLRHFWASTGLSPPEPYGEASQYLIDQDMTLNLAFIGALPRHQLMQVRIHWLLNLITIRMDDRGTVLYNFTDLDVLVERLHRNQLKPGLELMGNPSRYFTNFENKTQVHQWKDMVTALAKRYIEKHGLQYVKEWNFESWNEPDHKDFDGLNFTIKGFLNYYDACSEGLLAAHPSLRLGGPAESFRGSFVNFCWTLLDHCVNGRNYFTGQKSIRLDFISMHKKGNQSSISILEEELETIEEIQSKYPSLGNVSVYNDEADPLVGWWKPEVWRSDTTYASMVAKVINQHQDYLLKHSVKYRLLSNDNAFLPLEPHFFEQRTLVASFRKNGTKGPPAAQMIRKPIYMVTGLLLHVLGEEQVQVCIHRVAGKPRSTMDTPTNSTSSLGALAAFHIPSSSSRRDSWNLGVVVYNSDDMNSSAENNAKLEIRCHGLNNVPTINNDLMYVTYAMDNVRTNPAATWKIMGRPILPNTTQLRSLRNQEGPISSIPRPMQITSVPLKARLRQPGFLAVHLCLKARMPPGQVTNVNIHNVSVGDVLLTWQTDKVQTRCIWTFEIQFWRHVDGQNRRQHYSDYRTITGRRPIIFRSFQFTPSESTTKRYRCCYRDAADDLVRGLYRIRAIDYWSRPGRWSTPTWYGHDRY